MGFGLFVYEEVGFGLFGYKEVGLEERSALDGMGTGRPAEEGNLPSKLGEEVGDSGEFPFEGGAP